MSHAHICLVLAFFCLFVFFADFQFPGQVFLWCTWPAHYLERKLGWLTLPRYEFLTQRISATIKKRIPQCQQACEGSLGCSAEGPSVRGEVPGHLWQHGVSQVSHGVTCAPPNNSSAHYLLRTVGEASKCDHVLTRHSVLDTPPLPSLRLYIESNDLSDTAAFNRSHVTFVTLHASQICISVVSTYQSNFLMSRTSISHSMFSDTCVPA